MTWVRLDDGFIRNRKVRNLTHRAVVLHIAGLCHCAAQLTDGRIDKADAPMIAMDARVPKSLLAELVSKGVWHDHGDHFLIHDYLEYQESRETVMKRRKRWADQKAGQRNGDMSAADSTEESTTESACPVPSRPVLSTSRKRTTHHHQDGVDDDDGRFALVLDRLVDERIAKFPAKTNRLAYRTKVTESIVNEHGDTIRAALAARPEVDAELVAQLLGRDIA